MLHTSWRYPSMSKTHGAAIDGHRKLRKPRTNESLPFVPSLLLNNFGLEPVSELFSVRFFCP